MITGNSGITGEAATTANQAEANISHEHIRVKTESVLRVKIVKRKKKNVMTGMAEIFYDM